MYIHTLYIYAVRVRHYNQRACLLTITVKYSALQGILKFIKYRCISCKSQNQLESLVQSLTHPIHP